MIRLQYGFAALLLAIGGGFACLPDAWIESRFGVSPDGGNDWRPGRPAGLSS